MQPPTTLLTPSFLSPVLAERLAKKYDTPCYVYSQAILLDRAQQALAFPAPFGLTVRYAMKANPLQAILKLFHAAGVHIDASSGAEVERAMRAGIPARHIMLTSQEIPNNLPSLMAQGLLYNACSLHQLEEFGRKFPGKELSVRLNPGFGSGHRRSVSVGGPSSSFGIWHEHAGQARIIAKQYGLRITGVHSHIGCGADPEVWHQAANRTLDLLGQFSTATRLNLGGGFKVAHYPGETATNLQAVGDSLSHMLQDFARRTNRRLHLEIEPGTFLVANAGALLTRIIDITSTGTSGYRFAKLNTGLNDFMRPALHGSQHPIIPLTTETAAVQLDYVVVGHTCESTDLLTPLPSDSETPLPRRLPQLQIDDLVAIEGTGAYGSAMRQIGYNSFATPNEVMVTPEGDHQLINRRRTYADFMASEIS